MNELDKLFIDFLNSPMKTFLTTLSGTILGYVPVGKITIFANEFESHTVNTAFQHVVWTLTILVAITSLVNFVQKQYDRYKSKNKKGEEND